MTALLWVVLIGRAIVVIGGVRLLGVTGGVFLWTRSNDADEARRRRNESVRIEWLPPPAVTGRFGEPVDPYVSINDTLTALTFRLCNEGTETVRYVTFRPQTWHPDRSTAYDASLAQYWGDRTLKSDYYLARGEGQTLTWNGRFQVFYRIEARSVHVITQQ